MGFVEAVRPEIDADREEIRLTERRRKALAEGLPLWKKAQARFVDALGESRWSRMLDDLAETVAATQEG